jgi:hypothetical protein
VSKRNGALALSKGARRAWVANFALHFALVFFAVPLLGAYSDAVSAPTVFIIVFAAAITLEWVVAGLVFAIRRVRVLRALLVGTIGVSALSLVYATWLVGAAEGVLTPDSRRVGLVVVALALRAIGIWLTWTQGWLAVNLRGAQTGPSEKVSEPSQ